MLVLLLVGIPTLPYQWHTLSMALVCSNSETAHHLPLVFAMDVAARLCLFLGVYLGYSLRYVDCEQGRWLLHKLTKHAY